MNKRIYTSEDKDKLELEVSWSEKGIHIDIVQSDKTYLASLIFTEHDIDVLTDELIEMAKFLEESKKIN